MKTFTSEERNLMYLYNSGTRLELIDNLTDMRSYLAGRRNRAADTDRLCAGKAAPDERSGVFGTGFVPRFYGLTRS